MDLRKTGVQLYGPGGNKLTVKGMFEAILNYHQMHHKETVYVIDGQSTSLLGREACERLGLVTCQVKNQMEVKKSSNVLNNFPELCRGLGKLKGYTYEISLRPDSKPVCLYTPRRVPLPLRDKTKAKLKEMVLQGVISPVTEATDWCSGMVPVLKPSGEVRICVDLTSLNKAVRREVHPMPAVDESLALLSGSRIFTKLDANSGFWQIDLDKKSRHLNHIFNTVWKILLQPSSFRNLKCTGDLFTCNKVATWRH